MGLIRNRLIRFGVPVLGFVFLGILTCSHDVAWDTNTGKKKLTYVGFGFIRVPGGEHDHLISNWRGSDESERDWVTVTRGNFLSDIPYFSRSRVSYCSERATSLLRSLDLLLEDRSYSSGISRIHAFQERQLLARMVLESLRGTRDPCVTLEHLKRFYDLVTATSEPIPLDHLRTHWESSR